MSLDCDVEGGVDKEGWGCGAYILSNTIRLGRQEMSHVDSCISIRTWTIPCIGSHFSHIAEKGFSCGITS